MKNNKAITLIALVITVVILVILGGIAIGLTIGENGIINRAKQAALMQKKAQYTEEIGLEIIQEQTERYEKAKEEAFIVSINERLTGQKQASNQAVSTYTKKPWIENTIMCDEEKNINSDPFDNNRLYVYTIEGYELVIIVNNQGLSASIEEGSFQKTADKVNVTYNANGGTGSVEGQSVLPGFKVSLKESGFTKNKYTFTGWCKNADGSGDKYQPGSDLRITEDCTLYAVWSLNAVTITYDPNTGNGDMQPRDVEIDTAYQLTKNTFTKEGYEFSKWTTNANGTGDEYTDEANITASNDMTLYAQWTPVTYTITYALNGGSITGEKTSYTIEDANFTLVAPTKNGYTFAGWTGTDLNSATTSVTVSTGSTGARAYTATWTAITYSITYTLNGGTGASNRTYTVEDEVTLPTPTKADHNFTGWTGSNGETPQISVTIPTGTTGNKSYTANWSKQAYSVTLTAGEGIETVTGDGDYYPGDTVTVTATAKGNYTEPSFSGQTAATVGNIRYQVTHNYTFANWSGTYNSSSSTFTFTMPSNNVSLTANTNDTTGVTNRQQYTKIADSYQIRVTGTMNYGTTTVYPGSETELSNQNYCALSRNQEYIAMYIGNSRTCTIYVNGTSIGTISGAWWGVLAYFKQWVAI